MHLSTAARVVARVPGIAEKVHEDQQHLVAINGDWRQRAVRTRARYARRGGRRRAAFMRSASSISSGSGSTSMTPPAAGVALLHGDDLVDVLDVSATAIPVRRAPSSARWRSARRAAGGIWDPGALRMIREKAGKIPRVLMQQRGDPGQPCALRLATFVRRDTDGRVTLFSTLPTLCRTLVATSAMPAWREASSSCRCGDLQARVRRPFAR